MATSNEHLNYAQDALSAARECLHAMDPPRTAQAIEDLSVALAHCIAVLRKRGDADARQDDADASVGLTD